MFKMFEKLFFPPREELPENLAHNKDKYLIKAKKEANEAHPLIVPHQLLCPIGLELFKEPVITKEGFVYEKAEIQEWIKLNPTDPFSRNLLLIEDLYPFKELCGVIKLFESRSNSLKKQRKDLLDKAVKVAHPPVTDDVPSLFICPLSKEIIKEAVISKDGKIFDKKSLDVFSKTSSSAAAKEDALGAQDYLAFDEFQQQINVYSYYRSLLSINSHSVC